LALELNKAESKPATRSCKKPRASSIQESENDDDEDDAFEEIVSEEDDDDAFSEEVEEEPKAAKKRKGSKPTSATARKSASPAAKGKKSSNKPAPPVKVSPVSKPAPKPVRRSFDAPTGVSIVSGQGPRLRVGLSKRAIPKGPLSPVKITKS